MGARSGLLDVEVQLLRSVAAAPSHGGVGADGHGTLEVLTALDRRGVIGPRAGLQLTNDLLVPWRRHLPLLDGEGNWGSVEGDPPADADYTRVALSAAGRLALAAEDGTLGPVPLGLVDGSWYRGGRQPPYPPTAMLDALTRRDARGLVPSSPSGGAVTGDLDQLLAGRQVELSLSATVLSEPAEHRPRRVYEPPPGTTGGWFAYAPGGRDLRRGVDRDRLVVTELPYGVPVADALEQLEGRVQAATDDPPVVHYGPPRPPRATADAVPVLEVWDESSARNGLRVVAVLRPGADPDEGRRWLLRIRPLTVTVPAALPAPMTALLTGWDRGDGSGLQALWRLLG